MPTNYAHKYVHCVLQQVADLIRHQSIAVILLCACVRPVLCRLRMPIPMSTPMSTIQMLPEWAESVQDNYWFVGCRD
jgi:hypothetical protein